MLMNDDYDCKIPKIKSEFSYYETATPYSIIKMFKDNTLRESVCRFCLSEQNLRCYDDPVIVQDEDRRINDLFDELNIKHQELTSVKSDKICGDCVLRVTDFYVFVKKAKKTRQHFATFLDTVYNQNVLDYDSLNIHNTIYQYVVDESRNIDIETLLTNIELKYDGFGSADYDCDNDIDIKDEILINHNIKPTFVNNGIQCKPKSKKKTPKPSTCHKCLSKFESRTALTEHRKSCSSAKSNDVYFKCTHCMMFVQKSSKLQHMAEMHSDKRVVCNFCYKEFYFKCSIRYHIEHVHKYEINVCCTFCNVRFANSFLAQEHYCKFKCSFCHDNCAHGKYLESYKHQYESRLMEFQCVDCDFKYRYKFELLKHANVVHLNLPDEHFKCEEVTTEPAVKKKPEFLCTQCGKILMYKSSLAEHLIGHMGKTKCNVCNRVVNLATFEIHLKSHEPGAVKKKKKVKRKIIRKCEQCDYETYHKPLLNSHMNKVHLNIRPYVCTVCEKSFHSYDIYKDHKKIHTDERLLCEICNKTFANRKCLTLHQRQHTGERPYVCATCNQGFISSSLRALHVKKVHSNASVSCHVCGKMFHHNISLNRHIKHVHNGVKRKKSEKKTDNIAARRIAEIN